MNSQFVEIKEAVKLTGKSLSTITRLAIKYKDSKYVKIEGKKYLIAKELLSNEYSLFTQKNMNSEKKQSVLSEIIKAKDETIQILKSQLEVSKIQLEAKDKQINDLTETGKAQIYLIRDLQERLKLPEHKSEPEQKKQHIDITPPPEPERTQTDKTQIEANRTIILKLHNKGYSKKDIVRELRKQGIKNTLGHEYNTDTIRKVLKRAKE